jgi:hypothetical protein
MYARREIVSHDSQTRKCCDAFTGFLEFPDKAYGRCEIVFRDIIEDAVKVLASRWRENETAQGAVLSNFVSLSSS